MGPDSGSTTSKRSFIAFKIMGSDANRNPRRHPFQGRPDRRVYVISGPIRLFRTAKNVQDLSIAGTKHGLVNLRMP
jgi:hypothetical protein